MKLAYKTCSACSHVSVLDHLWLDLANLYLSTFITNHTTLHLTHPWHFHPVLDHHISDVTGYITHLLTKNVLTIRI